MTAQLRVIKSPPPPEPPDYSGIYRRAFDRKIGQLPAKSLKLWSIQMIYLGVKGLPHMFKDELHRGGVGESRTLPAREDFEHVWNFMQFIDSLISGITPRDLTRIFPVDKEYDGDRWGTKDYFYTMEVLERHGMDTSIGDSVSEILYDYQNWHVRKYEVSKMMILSDLRRYDGHPGLMEEFMGKLGVTPMRVMTDNEGRQFMYDSEQHTSFPLAKPRPRYLHVVK